MALEGVRKRTLDEGLHEDAWRSLTTRLFDDEMVLLLG